MCYAELAIGVATTVAQMAAAQETADRQNDLYQRNAVTANANAVEQYAQNQLSQIQEEAKATQERIANKAEVIKAKGTALAGAKNEGSSINSVINDLSRQGGRNDNITNVNVRNATLQKKANDTSIQSETKGRIDSVQQAEGPTLMQAAVAGLTNIGPYISSGSRSKYDTASTGGKKV